MIKSWAMPYVYNYYQLKLPKFHQIYKLNKQN